MSTKNRARATRMFGIDRKTALLPALALALGMVSAFAFQPVGWWPLMIVALGGLAAIIARSSSLKQAAFAGWLFGVGQFVVSLNWIAMAFTFQAAMPAWLGWVAVVLLSLYLAIYPMLAAAAAWKAGRTHPAAMVLTFGGAWALTEWFRSFVFTGFPWNPVSAAMVDTPLLPAARWIGTYGLSGLTALIAGALWLAVEKRRWRLPAGVTGLAIALAVLPAPQLMANKIRPIRIVQPNIGQDVKWDPAFERRAKARLENLSSPDGDRPELLFWPEAAVTMPLSDTRPGALPYVVSERRDATRPIVGKDLLLTGGVTLRSSDGQVADRAANSVFVLGPDGRFVGRYDKAHLVPYGEYLPMRPLLSALGLSRLAPGEGDFEAGHGPGTLALPEGWGKAGFQLCYEIIFSGEVIERNHRPDFLFNPSNDAWFGRWGPPQHLAQARLRAIEEGIPVVRSTPTGISALIDADGQVIKSLPWKQAGVIDANMPAARAPTLFARLGNLLAVAFGLLLVATAIALRRKRR